ncbi:MAG TPA: carbonic anhydrase [Spirochaetia bacterium]|nr:carbonic anhydrase [Spirochaetia bacterium]
MNSLFDGILHFQEHDYEQNKEYFQTIGRKQNPHTLFIGCSDSRIVPSLITNTLPGELFVVRNIANIVPHYRLTGEYVATTSAVEYALNVLKIDNIVVCGHSNCGGCYALWDEGLLADVPHTRHWLELAARVKDKVGRHFEGRPVDVREREWLTEQYNIVEQMRHLLSYPGVKDRYKSGSLKVFGWYYIIESGEVYNYDSARELFDKVK